MKWEYASLVRLVDDQRRATYTFYGPGGQQQEIQAENSVAILNSLGQDGWEVLGVETVQYSGATIEQTFWLERTFWLKRPFSTGS